MTRSDPMTAMRQYVDAFNRRDAGTMVRTFSVQDSILDGMAPHAWQGPTAVLDWYRNATAEGEHYSTSDYCVILGSPLHNDITGDRAYVIVPATMTFKLHGRSITQTGALFTAALRYVDGNWRICAWAWSKGGPLESQ